MIRATILMLAALVAVAVVPLPALAQTLEFKLLPRYSIATLKSDAPLETSWGTPVTWQAASRAASASTPPGRRAARRRYGST